MKVERAEAVARQEMTTKDRANYTGLAKHPLARKWMLRRLQETRKKAFMATTETSERRWNLEVKRMVAELRGCGVKLKETE